MQPSSSQRRTFTVNLSPAYHFLAGVMVMSKMNDSAVLIVKNGEVHISSPSSTVSAYGSVVMEATTATSWRSESFTIPFDPSTWIGLLTFPVSQQRKESLWIYKIGRSPDLYCTIGDDPDQIKLGEAEFVEERGIDIKNIPTDKVIVHLTTECLRDVIITFSPRFAHVMMMAKHDSVIWFNTTDRLTHQQEDGECLIEGVEPGDISYLLMEWRNPRFLIFASWITDEVEICTLIDREWKNWTLFSFIIDDRTSFLCMVRGSDSMLLYNF